MEIIIFFPFLPSGNTVKALDLLIVSLDLFFHFSIMCIFLSGQTNSAKTRDKGFMKYIVLSLLSTVSYFSSSYVSFN